MRLLLLLLLITAPLGAPNQVIEESQCSLDRSDEALHCFLRTLQSPIGPQGSEVTHVKKLKLKCSDSFFLESYLSSDHFGQLPLLEDLRLKYCKIRNLPAAAFAGLNSLKHLELQSHNGDWTSAVIMEVHADSFQKLSNLQSLNLAFNNLWTLPKDSLCDLVNLKKLNLSHNHILDMLDLGVENCEFPEVKTLDLSHNYLTTFRKNDLRSPAHLAALYLNSNRLGILADDAFHLMTHLKELNLADNQLAALPPTLFTTSAMNSLESLHLQNNSLTLLTPQLFSGLKNLLMLNLSHNALDSLYFNEDTFKGLLKLKVLDLSRNRLTNIGQDTFKSLPSLQVLDLSFNQLSVVNGNLGLQPSLRLLALSHNAIEDVHQDALADLNQLNSLSLDHNKIRVLPGDIFQGNANLEDLSFNNNQLMQIPPSLKYLTNLRTLDLGENLIKDVEDLSHLQNLYGLKLAGNLIKKISSSALANVTGIHVLNLALNQLETIERGAFDHLKELRALRLDHNYLSDINGLVSGLSKLQWFNVSNNKLQWFDYGFLPQSLEWLDIQYNEIEELGNYYKQRSGFNLKRLDASGNLIKNLTKLSLPMSLEFIALTKNAIRHIESGVFEDKPNLHRVELVDNEINHLKLSALSVGRVSPKGILLIVLTSFFSENNSRIGISGQPEFFLGGNPLVCDCGLDWLPGINSIEMQEHYPRVADLAEIKCRLNNQRRNDTIENVVNVQNHQFLCSYSTHCFSQCMCCEFYACDCRMQCPDGCSCFHDASWDTNIIQCGLRGHADVPLLIPMDATQIRLDGNNLTDVDSTSFIGRKRVVSLFLNGSQVTSISPQTFNDLYSLQVLHLENNDLKEIQGHEFRDLKSLRELYLQNNNLVRIAQHAFEAMPMLSVLRLDGNLLTNFPVWTLASSNPFLSTLTLAENMWSCSCTFAKPFKTYLQTFGQRIPDQDHVRCVTDNLVNEPILDRVCPELIQGQVSKVDTEDLVANDNLVTILVSVSVSLVCIICCISAVCCYRGQIKTWLYNKSSEIYDSTASRGSSSAISDRDQANKSKLFDVFICYCKGDEEFVDHTLAPTLEHGATSYRLCLQQRDFQPNALIYDNVTLASETSSRILVVLSRTFLTSQWAQVKSPLRNSIQGQDNKLVFLLLDDFAPEEIDLELKHYLKVCASVKWGSAGFINKLRFFLPEPAIQTFQRSVTLRTLHSSPPPVIVESSPMGSVNTQTTSVYHPYSQHTYQSIPETHIYHTLDPMEAVKPPVSAVYINKNLELILKPTTPLSTSSLGGYREAVCTPKSSPSKSESSAASIHHMHTPSGQELLPNDEYVV